VKKIDIVVLCIVIGLIAGCKKKPVETAVAIQPAAVKTAVDVTPPAAPEVKAEAAEVAPEPAKPQEPAPQEAKVLTAVEMPVKADRIEWMTDFTAAGKKAKEEGKDLFINFTGSDWCGWCIRLDKEVFSQKLFIYEAQKRFVFVYVDFPRTKKQPETLKKQNEQLARLYGAESFPTIILAMADGKPYGQTGYVEGGPLAYLQELARLQSRRPAK
jgi:protein disulfide-isomerase